MVNAAKKEMLKISNICVCENVTKLVVGGFIKIPLMIFCNFHKKQYNSSRFGTNVAYFHTKDWLHKFYVELERHRLLSYFIQYSYLITADSFCSPTSLLVLQRKIHRKISSTPRTWPALRWG